MTRLADHLKVNMTIDRETGDQRFTYFYKRKRCPTRLIEGPLAKKYIGYYLIMRDLEDAEAWLNTAYSLIPEKHQPTDKTKDNYYLESLGSKENHLIIKSLFFSSLIFYGKCFTQAKGRGIKLETLFVPDEMLPKHESIMLYRHNLAAHSGEGRWDTGNVNLVLPPKKGKDVGIHIKPETHRLDFEDDRMDENTFIDLIQAVHKKVKEKSTVIGNKIINEIIIPKGEDYWRQPASRLTKKGSRR